MVLFKFLISKLTVTLCLFFCVLCVSQNATKAQLYRDFDEKIKPINSGAYSGIEYQKHFMSPRDKHQYFKSKIYKKGFMQYKNEPFYEYLLKYDVYTDELILKNEAIVNASEIQLYKKYISIFSIDGSVFEHLNSALNPNVEYHGFYEILLKYKEFTFYKKHLKNRLKRSDENGVIYLFKDKFYFLLWKEERYELIKKASDFSVIFPNYKKELNKLQNKYKSLKKKDVEKYYISILHDLRAIIVAKKNQNS